jgi:hypothetical protein
MLPCHGLWVPAERVTVGSHDKNDMAINAEVPWSHVADSKSENPEIVLRYCVYPATVPWHASMRRIRPSSRRYGQTSDLSSQ